MKIRGDQNIEKNESSSMEIQHDVGESPTTSNSDTTPEESSETQIDDDRSFICKTCNRSFPSFQALGGHRTSHSNTKPSSSKLKRKMHACLICGAAFALGQSLGGHMRKHRPLSMNGLLKHVSAASASLEAVSVINGSLNASNRREALSFDLNLTPSENEV